MKRDRHAKFKMRPNGQLFTSRQKCALLIITFIDLMSFCSISFMSFFLPKETAQMGATLSFYNLEFEFSVVVTLLSSLFFGIMIPRFSVKSSFIGAVLLSRINTILFGVLHLIHTKEGFQFLSFYLRGLETLGACAYCIAGYTIVFATFPEEVGVIRGLLEGIVGIGTTMGPPVGQAVFTFGGFGLPFYFVGTFVIMLAIAGAYVVDDVQSSEPENKPLSDFLRVPKVGITCGVILVISTTNSIMDPSLGDYLIHALPFERVGFVYVVIAVGCALSSPIWGYITEKTHTHEWMMPIGLCLNGICLLLIEAPFSNELNPEKSNFFKLGCLFTLGVAMAMGLVPTLRCLTRGALERGFKNTVTTHSYVASTWTFMFSVGEILGPTIGLLLYKNFDFAISSGVVAAVNVLMGLVCALFLYCKLQNRSLLCTLNVTIHIQ